jgi:hypothetical protein
MYISFQSCKALFEALYIPQLAVAWGIRDGSSLLDLNRIELIASWPWNTSFSSDLSSRYNVVAMTVSKLNCAICSGHSDSSEWPFLFTHTLRTDLSDHEFFFMVTLKYLRWILHELGTFTLRRGTPFVHVRIQFPSKNQYYYYAVLFLCKLFHILVCHYNIKSPKLLPSIIYHSMCVI